MKRANSRKRICPIEKNDIPNNLRSQGPVIYSSTWIFVFETTPSADDCIVDPDYPAEAYF